MRIPYIEPVRTEGYRTGQVHIKIDSAQPAIRPDLRLAAVDSGAVPLPRMVYRPGKFKRRRNLLYIARSGTERRSPARHDLPFRSPDRSRGDALSGTSPFRSGDYTGAIRIPGFSAAVSSCSHDTTSRTSCGFHSPFFAITGVPLLNCFVLRDRKQNKIIQS